MLLISWNVGGLNSPLKQHEMVNLMKKSKCDVCGLLETKLVSSKLQFMHKFRLKHWRFFSNVEIAGTARIVVLWNPSNVIVDLINSSPQALHNSVRSLENQHAFVATFVYGYNTVIARRSLCDHLRYGLQHVLGLY